MDVVYFKPNHRNGVIYILAHIEIKNNTMLFTIRNLLKELSYYYSFDWYLIIGITTPVMHLLCLWCERNVA